MARRVAIALVGDFSPEVIAHRAIPGALEMSAAEVGVSIHYDWLHTSKLASGPVSMLTQYHAIWCVPACPYASTEAALAAIRLAREKHLPFLGTCGGFQHALMEYAYNVLGKTDVEHAEINPAAEDALIGPLSCALVEQSGEIFLTPGSKLALAYGKTEIVEEYHCRYGLPRRHEQLFDKSALRVVGRDKQGDVRAIECDSHPFYVATLFQPERAALRQITPSIVRAFVAAATRVTV